MIIILLLFYYYYYYLLLLFFLYSSSCSRVGPRPNFQLLGATGRTRLSDLLLTDRSAVTMPQKKRKQIDSSSDESGSDDGSPATNPKENETALNSAARKVFAESVPSNNVIKMGAKAEKVGTSKAQNPKKKQQRASYTWDIYHMGSTRIK